VKDGLKVAAIHFAIHRTQTVSLARH
jgi:hypothetical protein